MMVFHFQGKQTGRVGEGRVGEGGLSSWDVEDAEEMEEEIGEARVNVDSKGVAESSHFSKWH